MTIIIPIWLLITIIVLYCIKVVNNQYLIRRGIRAISKSGIIEAIISIIKGEVSVKVETEVKENNNEDSSTR